MANSIFLKLEGIDGSSRETAHEKWIEVVNANWAGHNSTEFGTDGTRQRGSVSFAPLSLVKTCDSTTPTLLDKMAQGKVIPSGELDICRQTEEGMVPILKYTLTNIYVSSLNLDAVSGDASVQHESITLDPEKVKVEYQGQTVDGKKDAKTEFTWNMGSNKAE